MTPNGRTNSYMITDELNALPLNTTIYLPDEWEVLPWLFAGKVHDRNFYTLLYPPDQDGVVNNRRPKYVDAQQLLAATLNETEAWCTVIDGLEDRKQWIYQFKLKDL